MHSSSAWIGLPTPELTAVCVRESLSAIFSETKFCDAHLGGCETLVSNVTHGPLIPLTTGSFVWHSGSFVTSSHPHSISDNWTCTTTSRDRYGGCTLFLVQTLAELVSCSWLDIWKRRQHHWWHFIEKWRPVLPRNCSNLSQETLDTIVLPMVGVAQHALQEPRRSQQYDDGLYSRKLTKPHSLRPLDIQCHVRVVRTVLAPQDSALQIPDLRHALVCQTTSRSLYGHPCTLHVLGHDVRHTFHQPSHHKVVGWVCCHSACAPELTDVLGAYP